MRLGKNQISVLARLAESRAGQWSVASGWCWGSHSLTYTILDSLVKRGLVDTTDAYGNEFEINETGREAVVKILTEAK